MAKWKKGIEKIHHYDPEEDFRNKKLPHGQKKIKDFFSIRYL